ncbi:MAG: DNA-binding NarL/FixJ family response regulator [Planctomycetota bacterium]|jgi:DNA-binding NarL/FixJ family response regulator
MFTVMLVDDHQPILRGLKAQVNATGIATVVAAECDGAAALVAARNYRPDLVLLDVSLPDMAGTDIARALLEENKELRILAVSCYTNSVFVNAMINAGASGYMLKENSIDEIKPAIKTVMSGGQWLSKDLPELSY